MSGFVFACASRALLEGCALEVLVDGRKVALARVQGLAHAIDGTCPHRGGDLGRGDLLGHHLFCPAHAWAFDVRTGQAFFPQGAKVPCFAVKEEGGAVLVDLGGDRAPAWRPPFGADNQAP